MAKTKSDSSLWGELFQAGLYKRNQGRLTRQVTAAALAVIVFYGAWTLSQSLLIDVRDEIRIGVPLALALLGAWLTFRAVNYPRFADFLISVEAEMDKVSWSSRQELMRSTVVVLVVMFLLGGVLFLYDQVWMVVFSWIGFLKLGA